MQGRERGCSETWFTDRGYPLTGSEFFLLTGQDFSLGPRQFHGALLTLWDYSL